jgi:hypothetical protein
MTAKEKASIPRDYFDPLKRNVIADLAQITFKYSKETAGVVAIIHHRGKAKATLVLAPPELFVGAGITENDRCTCISATVIPDPDNHPKLWHNLPANYDGNADMPTIPVMYFAFGSQGHAVFLSRLRGTSSKRRRWFSVDNRVMNHPHADIRNTNHKEGNMNHQEWEQMSDQEWEQRTMIAILHFKLEGRNQVPLHELEAEVARTIDVPFETLRQQALIDLNRLPE